MENINLLKKIAWSFSTSTNVEFDDLFQEAALAYLEAMRTYDESKGKISTHVWHCVQNQLKNYVKAYNKYDAEGIDGIELPPQTSNTPFWESLSEEAQEVAEVVLSCPDKYIAKPIDEAQIEVVQTLLNKGWDWAKIYMGMKNLKANYA